MTPQDELTVSAALRRLIADDAYAITFQTFGQYRTALLKAIDAAEKQYLAAAAQPTPVAHLYRDHYGTLKIAQTEPPPDGAFPVYTAAQRQPDQPPAEGVDLPDGAKR